MAEKTKKISTLIESQLPDFIVSEYENFSKFLEKYYEQLESQGQAVDIISNITKYRDINFYEDNILNQFTVLSATISPSQKNILVEDATSFPEKNGYIKIGDEICFYASRTDTEFLEVSRGVSGNTTLGDLYNESEFVTTEAKSHYQNDTVYNVSNLFLYAFIKSFESQYLDPFPEKYLKKEVDKRSLIKNITDFYQSKGTEKSVQFVFNSLISKSAKDIPTTYNPKDFTIKASTSDWVTKYVLKTKVISGNVTDLIGELIVQNASSGETITAVVDNIVYSGSEGIYDLILSPSTISAEFKIASKTSLKNPITVSDTAGDRIDVFSTFGWADKGKLLINNEEIEYTSKNINQFVIGQRGNVNITHTEGSTVYSLDYIFGRTSNNSLVKIIPIGVLYDLTPQISMPYSEVGDKVQIKSGGIESNHPLALSNWFYNTTFSKAFSSVNSLVNNQINDLISDVSAIYEDDQYFYVCSSSYPNHSVLSSTYNQNIVDQKLLRLIRKTPTPTTELYPTTTRDVGIFLDGSPAFSYKDFDFVVYGKIQTISIDSKGNGYKAPPYVLINDEPFKAKAILSGEVVSAVEIKTDDLYTADPVVTITSGRNAKIQPIVTNGKITSVTIVDPGEYYSSPPIIRIIDKLGKGNFAEVEAVVSADGKLTKCNIINGGRFYTRQNLLFEIIPQGSAARATASVKRWVKDRYANLNSELDQNNGYAFISFDTTIGNGYGVVANPVNLRYRLSDNINSIFQESPDPHTHSPIIGFAYDGNPIYGPYGYSNPYDATSTVTRIKSGYKIQNNRTNGPTLFDYPIGSFIDDYRWTPSTNSGKTELDKNNGRFCVTPEYPEGTYAYFVTIDSSGAPAFPYILGENYYSLPVDSNYNSKISQSDIPSNVKRLKTDNFDINGVNSNIIVKDVLKGNINGVTVEDSPNTFAVGSNLYVENLNTSGDGAKAYVSEVRGKNVVSIESKDVKASRLTLKETAYLFEGDTLYQGESDVLINKIYIDDTEITESGFAPAANVKVVNDLSIATGVDFKLPLLNESDLTQAEIVGNVENSNTVIVRNVNGSFSTDKVVFSSIKVVSLLLDTSASYSQGAILSLRDSGGKVVATGQVLEGTVKQNSVKIRVATGEFFVSEQFVLKSNTLEDTNSSSIIFVNSLSDNLTVLEVNENIAITQTGENHGLGIGDFVNISLLPDDSTTETTYYVRKKLFQKVILKDLSHESKIVDTGIGRYEVLNFGADYRTNTYEDVELIFVDSTKARKNIGKPGDSGNARATIVVNDLGGNYGRVTSITLTKKGSGYQKTDILTVADSDLNRLGNSQSTFRLNLFIDHAGFSAADTKLLLNNVSNLSANDFIKIGEEIVKISSVNVTEKSLIVERSQKGTKAIDHYNGKEVIDDELFYSFASYYRPLGDSSNSPFFDSFDKNTKEFITSYNYGVTTPTKIAQSSIFFDLSSPSKLIQVQTRYEPEYYLQFSKDNLNFDINPIIDIQKYYKYKFDTSHPSMDGTFIDFSPSTNYNVLSEEKLTSSIAPGMIGSYTTLKLGFGPLISSNNLDQPVDVRFKNYYYYIQASNNVNTQNAFLRVIDDPLSGKKKVTYTTPNKFVYELSSVPQYDGSGSITYTTSSQFAVGEISKIFVSDTGKDYDRLPTISGVLPSPSNQSTVDVIYDEEKNIIKSIKVLNQGQNYSKPIALVVDGDGKNYKFDCLVEDGKVKKVEVLSPGFGFTYKPIVKIYESDVKLYFRSDNIGLPQSFTIIDNGILYHNDSSTYPEFNSVVSLIVKNFDEDSYSSGETITQIENGIVTAKGKVAKYGWRVGANILRLEKVEGIFKVGAELKGSARKKTCIVSAILSSKFTPTIKSYFDNIGYFNSDKGRIGESSQRITDSYFYQDYSYVIKSKTPIDFWRDLIYQTTHPAGFKLFGELIVEGDAKNSMPVNQVPSSHYTVLNVETKLIESFVTKQQVTQNLISIESINVSRGIGTVSVDPFDGSETEAKEILLSQPFDADFNEVTGQRVGTDTFTLIDADTKLPYHVGREEELLLTIDGILQEPRKSYTVNGSKVTFTQPPFGERLAEGQVVSAQNFKCRAIKFKSAELNSKYLYKVQDISSQFDGVTTEFELYRENGGIVKSDYREKFIVVLDGILQSAKEVENFPVSNSYYIRRSEDENQTDVIVFSEPPINHEDLYENIEQVVDAYSKCFIYSIGNYYRLTIDPRTVKYRGTGPFLLLDERTFGVVKIENAKYAMVFVNGVLQEPGFSYDIVGPSITFTKPLPYFNDNNGNELLPNVSIILFYGRDIEKSCKFFDFEPSSFFVQSTLSIDGTNYDKLDFYNWYNSNEGDNDIVNVYQDDVIIGRIIRVSATVEDFKIKLKSGYYYKLSSSNLKFVNQTKNNELILTGDYTVTTDFYRDEFGQLQLVRDTVPWLDETVLAEEAVSILKRSTSNLVAGDKVLIDGESEYREILRVLPTVTPKQYNNFQDVTNDYYSTVFATNYDGVTRGEGLSVTSKIDENGSVTELVWNKRDLELYFNTGVLLPATAYSYFTSPELEFVPKTENGGGAKARVIVYGGQVLDIELIDGGYGYEQPPTVVVSRGYTRIKTNRETYSRVDYTIIPKVSIRDTSQVISTISIIGAPVSAESLFVIIDLQSIQDTSEDIVIIPATIEEYGGIDPDSLGRNQNEFVVNSPTIQIDYVIEKTETFVVSIIDAKADIITSASIVSTDREITSTIKRDINKAIIQENVESLNEVGAYLDAPLSETDTIVYIPDTTRFPDSSRLLIGKEIVTYLNKKHDRFLNVERGTFNTTATTHNAGDFILHLPEVLSVVSGGAIQAESEIITTVSVEQSPDSYSNLLRVTATSYSEISTVDVNTVSIQVVTINDINVDTSQIILSTQIVSALDNAFVTVLSERFDLVQNEILVTNSAQIETDTSLVNTSITITQAEDTLLSRIYSTVSTIAEVSKSIECLLEPKDQSVSITNNTNTVVINSAQIETDSSLVSTSTDIVSVLAYINTQTSTIIEVSKSIECLLEPKDQSVSITNNTNTVVTNSAQIETDSSLINTSTDIISVLAYINTQTSTITEVSKSIKTTIDLKDQSVSITNNTNTVVINSAQIETDSSLVSTSTDIVSVLAYINTQTSTIIEVSKSIECLLEPKDQSVSITNNTNTVVTNSAQIETDSSLINTSTDIISVLAYINTQTSTITEVSKSIKTTIELKDQSSSIVNTSSTKIVSSIDNPILSYFTSSIITIASQNTNLTNQYSFGFVDFYDLDPNDSRNTIAKYNLGVAGYNMAAYSNNIFMSYGAVDVGNVLTLEQFDFYYGNLLLGDFSDRQNSAITTSGELFNIALPSINEVGSVLTQDITPSSTTIQIENGDLFPANGTIIIGTEIISYSSRSGNILTISQRGDQNTTIQTHTTGDYIRTFE